MWLPNNSDHEIFGRELDEGLSSSLPLNRYLNVAVYRCQHDGTDGNGQQLFEFTRLANDHPELWGMDADEALDAVQEVLSELSEEDDPWQALFERNEESAQTEFSYAWDRIKVSPRLQPMNNALEWSAKHPIRPGPTSPRRAIKGFWRFVSLAAWLQAVMGDHDILLPIEKVGDALGTAHQNVSNWIQFAVEAGFLKHTRVYKPSANGAKGKAARYRFDVHEFPIIVDYVRKGTAEAMAESFEKATHKEHPEKRKAGKVKNPAVPSVVRPAVSPPPSPAPQPVREARPAPVDGPVVEDVAPVPEVENTLVEDEQAVATERQEPEGRPVAGDLPATSNPGDHPDPDSISDGGLEGELLRLGVGDSNSASAVSSHTPEAIREVIRVYLAALASGDAKDGDADWWIMNDLDDRLPAPEKTTAVTTYLHEEDIAF